MTSECFSRLSTLLVKLESAFWFMIDDSLSSFIASSIALDISEDLFCFLLSCLGEEIGVEDEEEEEDVYLLLLLFLSFFALRRVPSLLECRRLGERDEDLDLSRRWELRGDLDLDLVLYLRGDLDLTGDLDLDLAFDGDRDLDLDTGFV